MTTLLVSQPQGAKHVAPKSHPERGERLEAINKVLGGSLYHDLVKKDAVEADLEIANLVHCKAVLQRLSEKRPAEGISFLDDDTYICSTSFEAAAAAVGAGLQALDAVMLGQVDNAFCAIRPPGHHAEINKSMGFCLVNNIAIVAREAQKKYGVERIGIVDFDVHHGNGTQDIFYNDESVFYASSHQAPLYPGTGKVEEIGVGNIVNCLLRENSGGEEMREAYVEKIFPALENFSPDLILVSAGFDAHERDPLAQLNWRANDFAWVTGKLMDIAGKYCNNHVVSLLEGGYDLHGLADGVNAHVSMLKNGSFSG